MPHAAQLSGARTNSTHQPHLRLLSGSLLRLSRFPTIRGQSYLVVMKRVLAMFLLLSAIQLAAQTPMGPLSPGTLGNNNTTCPFAYTSTVHLAPAGNSTSSNNVYSSAAHCDCCDTHTSCLEARNYGFTIPGTATILGIRVEVERRRSAGAGGYIEDNGVMLLRGGSYVGANRAAYGVNWPTTDTYATYGGSADLWGTTWTPADINSANFGVALACISYTCGSAMTSFIDHIRITVFYDNTLGHEMTAFTAHAQDGGVLVNWAFQPGEDVQQLELERAQEDAPFGTAALLVSGTTSYLDPGAPSGRVRYRLRWMGTDGEEGIGPVAELGAPMAMSIHLSTENGWLRFSFPSPAQEGEQMLLQNAAGVVVSRLSLEAGKTEASMRVAELPAGVYFARHLPTGEVVKWVKRPD
jgi:hypothetical protein